eukprot:6793044-Alexandrium_andersonii.AAC.1
MCIRDSPGPHHRAVTQDLPTVYDRFGEGKRHATFQDRGRESPRRGRTPPPKPPGQAQPARYDEGGREEQQRGGPARTRALKGAREKEKRGVWWR